MKKLILPLKWNLIILFISGVISGATIMSHGYFTIVTSGTTCRVIGASPWDSNNQVFLNLACNSPVKNIQLYKNGKIISDWVNGPRDQKLTGCNIRYNGEAECTGLTK